MGNRAGQVDMTEPFTADLARDNLDAALFADDAAMLHALVLAAVAFVVLGRTENLGAKEPVTFRLESPVIDRFRLLDFAERSFRDLVRRGDGEPDGVEIQWVFWPIKQAVYIFQGPSSLSDERLVANSYSSSSSSSSTSRQSD